MAPVPARESGFPLAGADRGPAAGRDDGRLSRLSLVALTAVPALLALWIAVDAPLGTLAAVPDAARAIVAALALFAIAGYGVTRFLLPAGLREWEALWVLPVGACSVALAMALLGFAAVPYKVNLVIVLLAAVALDVVAVRRRGWGTRPAPRTVWPAYVAVLLIAVAITPMLGMGFATVSGNGSDAHIAVGSAQFLQHAYPTGVDSALPLDRIPLTWRSKPPIYYALAAVSSLSGLEPFQAIMAVAAVLLALAAVGMFLVARELLGAGLVAAVCATGLAGLDRMVLHTGLNPYFNQTWGYLTMPFALVLAWWVVTGRTLPARARPAAPPSERRGALALLVLFLAVGAFAYPLALPIPAGALVLFWWFERRARRRAGQPVADLSFRRFYRGGRSLLWMVPLAVLLAVPVYGVVEKMRGAASVVLDPNRSLEAWGGDLAAFVPAHQFFALSFQTGSALAVALLAGLAAFALSRAPRPLAWAYAAMLLGGGLAAWYFRQRDFGWYFHFKTLAFVGPLLVVAAAVGASRLRRAGPILLLAFLLTAQAGARQEVDATGRQLSISTVALRAWADALPPGASVRLDMNPPMQLWAAYFLADRPTCSERPLLNTGYPHVPISRRADYVVVERGLRVPFDARGGPLRVNAQYELYRLKPNLPGPDRCSRRAVRTITEIASS